MKAENTYINIYAKLGALQASIREIPKSGFNKIQNYAFRTIDDVLATYKIEMDKIGLAIVPAKQEFTNVDIEAGAQKPKIRVWVRTTFLLIDTTDGSRIEFQGLGEGVDFAGDKATYKAMTGAQKYALTMLLTMPCDGFDVERTDFEPGNSRGR